MESTLLGLVIDSSVVITAERKKQSVPEFIATLFNAYGPLDLSLLPITVAELVHGIYRSRTPEAAQRRQYVEELVSLIPVHPITDRTAWLVGQIEDQEAARVTYCHSMTY